MDDKFSGKAHKINDAESSSGAGKKKNLEWDLNDWKWDGHHFIATPLNSTTSDCRNKQLIALPASNRSSSCSEEIDVDIVQKRKGELEKKRYILGEEDNQLCGEDRSLRLKLGGHNHQLPEEELGNSGKRSKLLGGNLSRYVCQVEGCGADLSNARDYHRRHKVCEMHTKASGAMVGGVLQRFCQQCSRFQLLEEFDEGKRSCRRRLAGHNRRRRKTHPDTTVSSSLTDDTASGCLLINLLNALANLHSDNSDKPKDQDFLSHVLGNFSSLAGSSDSRNLSGTLQASQDLHAAGTSTGLPSESTNALLSNVFSAKESLSNPLGSPFKATCNRDNQGSLKSANHPLSVPAATLEMPSRENIIELSPRETLQAVPSKFSPTLKPAEDVLSAKGGPLCSLQPMLPSDSSGARFRINDFDLNCLYSETPDSGVGCKEPIGLNSGAAKSRPPQPSCNSEPSSVHPLSSTDCDAQSRTDRIVFKLFGKGPNDVPLVLRAQILDWLSHTPTDVESYIRPGCLVFTVYLHLDDSIWEELYQNLCSSLNRLLCTSGNDFWRTGWIYARLQNRMAFICNGNIVLDATPLLLESLNNCQIVCVTPIAAVVSARVNFTVQGFNLAQPTTRLLCAFEGKYLGMETAHSLVDDTDLRRECDGYQYHSFSCSLPDATGRGVIEVEDHGVSSGFFPFVVAEGDVCREIRTLENLINIASCDYIFHENLDATSVRHQAMNFLNEMGWLLRRSHLKAISKQVNSDPDPFSLKRFRWLVAFAMDQEWCAVIKNLLDMLFQGIVDLGGQTPSELASSENLLHIAVKNNRKLMVKLLVTYKPSAVSEEKSTDCFLFRPDMLGPSDITPLHVAASISGAEGVVDALIDDPGQYGIKAWKSARDSIGFTPEDYALAKGHQSYILLVQKKINNATEKSHVVLDIDGSESCKPTIYNIEKCTLRQTQQSSCKLCNGQQLACRTSMSQSLLYRPLMLLMVGIAAVCVCVGLLFKGPPEVIFVYHPFRWESLEFGTM